MASFDSHIGDIGLEIVVHFQTCDCDGNVIDLVLSGTDTITICLRKPDQSTILSKIAVITDPPCGLGDGSDGKASYITVGGDLDVAGTWTISGKVVTVSGDTFRATEATFTVRTPVCP